jgi:hypothetical protein
MKSYREMLHHREKLEESRRFLREKSADYVKQFGLSLEPFFLRNKVKNEQDLNAVAEPFRQIGFGDEEIDAGLLVNPTLAWREAIMIRGMELGGWLGKRREGRLIRDNLMNALINKRYPAFHSFEALTKSDQQIADEAYMILMSDQMWNDKFFAFLTKNAKSDAEKATINEIMIARNEFLTKVPGMAASDKWAVAASGPHELDSDYQIIAGLATIKWLHDKVVDKFGPVNPMDKNSLSFHSFCTIAIREVANVDSLTNGSIFARHGRVDPVYSHEDTLNGLAVLIRLMKEHGFITQDPQVDYPPFYVACQILRNNDQDRYLNGMTNEDDRRKKLTLDWFPVRDFANDHVCPSEAFCAFDCSLGQVKPTKEEIAAYKSA